MNEPTPGPPTCEAQRAQGRRQATARPRSRCASVSKYFGSVNALEDVSLKVYAGEVTCVLGDNGAGKSTLIKILSGVHAPDKGELLFEGEPVQLRRPRATRRARGIATVFQDLATVPLMSVWRNFFLGNEPTRGRGPLQRLDIKQAQRIMREEMAKMGIDVRDPDQTVGTLSGGERQAVAIARAVYFGAKVLILDEPTSALGVRQSGIVLKYIVQARAMGRAVIFITHNPHHAYPVGDRFVLLKRGRMLGSYAKSETSLAAADLDDGRRRRARGAEPRAPARGRPVDRRRSPRSWPPRRRRRRRAMARDLELLTVGPDQHRPVLRAARRRLARGAELQQGGRRQPDQRGDRRRPPRAPRAPCSPRSGTTRSARSRSTSCATSASTRGSSASSPARVTPLAFAVLDPPEDPQLLFRRDPPVPDFQLRPGEVDAATVARRADAVDHRRRAVAGAERIDGRGDAPRPRPPAPHGARPRLPPDVLALARGGLGADRRRRRPRHDRGRQPRGVRGRGRHRRPARGRATAARARASSWRSSSSAATACCSPTPTASG